MANITAADVNKLRQMTGAGMMDCKKALVEADGDFEAAIDILRKKGQKVASKRADRDANEGMVYAKTTADATFGVVVMINCETDFVAKNDDFTNFTKSVVEVALQNKPQSEEELKALSIDGRSIEDHITDMIGKIGEKIDLAHYEYISDAHVTAYNHHGNRLATLVGFNKAGINNDVYADVAMQVAAMAPVALNQESVPAEVIERELEIARDVIRQEGKPEEMVEKIAQGKLAKFFKESTLVNQEFIKDNKKTVSQYLIDNDKDLVVTGFKRLMLGA